MNHIARARELKQVGLFSDALKVLAAAEVPSRERLAVDVLRMELLETTGEYEPARVLATNSLKSRHVNDADKSLCEYVLGRIDVELGKVQSGIAHFQRSALCAQQAKDIEAEFHARVQLFNVLFERLGPGGSTSLLSEIRALATKLGDPRCTAKLHLFVAAMEARRGLFSNARRHTSIARNLLQDFPHAYYEAFAENIALGISVMQSEFESARIHGHRAMELCERAGLALLFRASMGNLGSLYYALGDFDAAVEYLQRGLIDPSMRYFGPYGNAALEGLARVHLMQGHVDTCRELLERIDASVLTDEDRSSYVYREAELTRAYLLAKEHLIEEAIASTEAVVTLAARAGDALSVKKGSLAKAELCERFGLVSTSMAIIEGIAPSLIGDSPELFAQAEQTIACALLREGDRVAGQLHRDRASRICISLRSVAAERILDERWADAVKGDENVIHQSRLEGSPSSELATRRALHDLATVLAYSGRPEIVARELVDLINSTGSVYAIRATSGRQGDSEQTLASAGSVPEALRSVDDRTFEIGSDNDGTIRLAVKPKNDVDSIATINAIRILLNAIDELKNARHEREQRATLWPVEELPIEGDSSVISGHMRELMTYARRIAKTKVNVLITGESGTGKEILARAIHNFSDRADKPFVPFNCTAIPRDLLESQLFGHRRGAFTGADRDHAGIIRAAREGTLFLDEIGELSLDLQPKLLRFLESGEIAPLGETGPLTIDVRIVAATNMNLEDAVHAGRFREDLFYRLNVVRLSLRPLRERRDEIPTFVSHFVAHAADEFKKGHLTVPEETMERLLLYRWPGNVRQLHNELRRIVALAEPNSTITPEAINEDILGALPIFRRPGVNGSELSVSLRAKLLPTLSRIECEMIKAALKEHGGKVNAVAKALGISRKGLYLKRQRLGL
jgi:transcriptional regulator with PAS, ATPase and Fis domain